MSGEIIRLENISKFFGYKLIFSDVSLAQGPGDLALLLGENGSGKSTLLKIMAGLSKPTSGSITTRGTIGYLGHATFLYSGLTARENLTFWAKAHGIRNLETKAIDEIMDRVGLLAHAEEKTAIFSRGMAQRLNFCRVLLLAPDLLLLDEPFTGLDQHSSAMMRDELGKSKKKGTSIIMVSHSPDVDIALADNVFKLENRSLQHGLPNSI